MYSDSKTRLSITVDNGIYSKAKAAAAALGISVSAWIALAIAEKLKRDSRKKSP